MGVVEDVAFTTARASGGITNSSRDCCNEGITRSSREDEEAGVLGGVVEGWVEESASLSTCVPGNSCDGGWTTLYPDEPSDSMMSGAPSIESRRVVVVFLALPRVL
jgi:hypothetical protein